MPDPGKMLADDAFLLGRGNGALYTRAVLPEGFYDFLRVACGPIDVSYGLKLGLVIIKRVPFHCVP